MALYHQHWNGGQWAGWQGLGGQLTSDVSASASTVTGRTDVFGRGTDNALWHQSGAGGVFSGWESLGGLLLGSLDPVTLNVPIVKQTMNLDCETAALQMALWAYGHYYSQAELFSLEKPDTRAPITSNGLIVYWGDPYTNFVGDVNGTDHFPPTGYGIYYPLILSIAQSHGAPSSTGGESNSVSSVYGALMAGKPVLTWVEVGWFHPAVHYWKAWDGRSIRYTLDEHTVTLSGLTLTQVRVNDPWHGTQYWVSRGTFERSFADFNNMAVIVTP
jgi:uncharacterized protein YvpB